MEKGNRYERERGEDESKEEGIKREREKEREQTRARFSLLVSHGPVFMNGFARGLREIVLSLLPLLSRSLSLSLPPSLPLSFPFLLGGCQPPSFSGRVTANPYTQRQRQ